MGKLVRIGLGGALVLCGLCLSGVAFLVNKAGEIIEAVGNRIGDP